MERTVQLKFFKSFGPTVTAEGLVGFLLTKIDSIQTNFIIEKIVLTNKQWELVREKVSTCRYLDKNQCRFGPDAALFGIPLFVDDSEYNYITCVRR